MTVSEENMAGEILDLRGKLDRAIDLWGEGTDEIRKLKGDLGHEQRKLYLLVHLAMDAIGRGENLNYHVAKDASPNGIGWHGPHANVQRDLHRLARDFWDYMEILINETPDLMALRPQAPDPRIDGIHREPFASTRSADGRYPI